MHITFSFIDIVIIIGICQGLFLSLVIQRIKNTNRKANITLSILILISTFMLIGRFLMIRAFSDWVFLWSLLFDVVIFLFGPLFYLYTRKLLFQGEEINKLAIYHYVPAILYSGMAIVYIVIYTPTQYFEAYKMGKLDFMFNVVLIAAIISNFYYLILSFKVLGSFKRIEKHTFSFEQNPTRFITFFLYAISAILVAWLFSYINSAVFDRLFAYISYDIVWAAIPVFIYVIGYYSLKQPELFRVSLEKTQTDSKNRLEEVEAQKLKDKLDSLMCNEQVYLQNDLTLRDVAEKLQTSTNNISWLLNNIYKSTFYDFINGHRIKEFVNRIENKEHLKHTILALSIDVGFNSKSTFNKAFKQTMKDTPSNFIKKQSAA